MNESLITVGEIYCIAFAGFHLLFWRIFDWAKDLRSLSFLNRAIMHSYEDSTSACIIYQFSKPGITLPMTQLFEVKNEKISKILLIFDTGKFTQH